MNITRYHAQVDIALTVAEMQRLGLDPRIPDVVELLLCESYGYTYDFATGQYVATEEAIDETVNDSTNH